MFPVNCDDFLHYICKHVYASAGNIAWLCEGILLRPQNCFCGIFSGVVILPSGPGVCPNFLSLTSLDFSRTLPGGGTQCEDTLCAFPTWVRMGTSPALPCFCHF
ncbi:uncharacterized protein LOC106995129 isoform X2 [Macaca mulatta]